VSEGRLIDGILNSDADRKTAQPEPGDCSVRCDILGAYMRGFSGALVAVPILVSTKIVFSHVPAFQPLASLFRR
jgi:hypothetical protein